ncbi:MAG: 30S ribosome-binding factor RbfA [Bdellovibrionales bacterium]|nr:30S ribosome-binding factor RbfA [Bdellovibrionales bacterium]
MTESRRVQRVEKGLREIIGTYLVRHFSSQMLSVGNIIVSGDLRSAKVFISRIGQDKMTKEEVEVVQEHAVSIQREISSQLHMKFCPRLTFLNDDAVGSAKKLDELFEKIKN